MTATNSWHPDKEVIERSNIHKMMLRNGFEQYDEFWKWSVDQKEEFWAQTIANLGIHFDTNYKTLLDLSKGEEKSRWIPDARLNIVDSCFQNDDSAIALVFQKEDGELTQVSQRELLGLVNRVANSLVAEGLTPGQRIAIDMPMTLEAVCIYLGAIKAGLGVVTIADSFAPKEIQVRLRITKPQLVFTQDLLKRAGKTLPMYEKVLKANPPKTIVVRSEPKGPALRAGDLDYHQFLTEETNFKSHVTDPGQAITILFSSGTTGEPKAIPWDHVTPVKGASDGYYHHDIHPGDVVCWPTNLGWMMGPWLIFASLINKASIALYYGAPLGTGFGRFVQDAGVTMLGVVPSLVRQWKISACNEGFDWSRIRCFSSTGEASNPDEMSYLMQLGQNKPVIEYCGGTEVGGGYVTSTVVQPNIPSTFSSQALGGEFVLIDEDGEVSDHGEMFLVPPIPGLSTVLLNRDHHEVYYKDTPVYQGIGLRRHGDELVRLENGYYRAQGRADDSMNLGGIKVSSIQIEEIINQLEFIKESAAIAVSPREGGPSELILYAVCLPSGESAESKLSQVRKTIRNKLNPLFKVQELIELEALPRTASGKVMRRELRKSYQEKNSEL
jgi:acetyl-CoA synthetase